MKAGSSTLNSYNNLQHICSIRGDDGISAVKDCGPCARKRKLKEYSANENFQVYREIAVSNETDIITHDELQVFNKIFKMLGSNSLGSLFLNKGKIQALKKKVEHVHPLNFLESLVKHSELRAHFLSVVDRGGIVWKECFGRFKENLSLQNSFGNIEPHIESFSQNVGVEKDGIKKIFESENPKSSEIHNLLLSALTRDS